LDEAKQLILICGIIIVAYLIDLFARRVKVPAVLFLMLLGILLRQITERFELGDFDFTVMIPVLGTLGLILIVFEGALDLDYEKKKNKTIRNALLLSFFLLVATSVGIAILFRNMTGFPFHHCLINAIPLSIISSAIAIPSVVMMNRKTREFITYESTFSDILGIVLFNYAIANSVLNAGVFVSFGIELISVTVLSLTASLILVFLLKSINHPVKFILIITVMVFLYAIGKYFHLSSLILVLVFGLFLKNLHLFHWSFFQKHFSYPAFDKDFKLLHQITAEGVFLIKTFFFVIFGFIIDFSELLSVHTLMISLLVIMIIYLIRAVFMRILSRDILPEVFISPRGLITILLYLSIPEEYRIPDINAGVLFMVVLISSFMMLLGRRDRKKNEETQEQPEAQA
jgi:Kef-type K+ transport system membrane component KefB